LQAEQANKKAMATERKSGRVKIKVLIFVVVFRAAP
jgi:hypothetical protein